METKKLCEAVEIIPPGEAKRRWVLCETYRCAGGSHHHCGKVRLSESPLYLHFGWRRIKGGLVRHVGIFRLDLHGLLRAGYIRHDKPDGHGASVWLKIFRADDGKFYVNTKAGQPALYFAADIP